MAPDKNHKIGIIAGGGDLPRKLIDACKKNNQDFHVIAFKGQADKETTDGISDKCDWLRLGAIGKAIDILKSQNCKELVMGGTIRRPGIGSLLPDARTAKFFLKTGAMALGDNGLLSAIVKTLEEDDGFRIIGVHNILPELLAPLGVLGAISPSNKDAGDIATAIHAALDLGRKDLGQGAVVSNGKIIALEEKDGTDAMLARVEKMEITDGGVLVKVVKPGQERRVDLPTIGVDTVAAVSAAKLGGIGIEAGGAIIVEREKVINAANNAGIFIIGINPSEFGN
ncbi:MAG: UDP-2,3-diacylglucosamine diphosphatase LpxI [Rhodospirillaceae bacterium]|nr:UDP-2,3-diacylglucosamine diphosphatase LpxI [Rhodospirillaceae bacterium]MCK5546423.1 UDP-2,3-diacylglucosamine diphosphatase LpxI [Rhodospirillaceae bacterium]